jgi:DNA polymerase-3 subunit beta
MTTHMSIESDGSISVAVPSRLTIETLKSLPNQPVTFTIDEKTFQVQIQSEFGNYKLSGQAAKISQRFLKPNRNHHLQLPQKPYRIV